MASIQIIDDNNELNSESELDDSSSINSDAVELMNTDIFKSLQYFLESKDGTTVAENLENIREEQKVIATLLKQLIEVLSKKSRTG